MNRAVNLDKYMGWNTGHVWCLPSDNCGARICATGLLSGGEAYFVHTWLSNAGINTLQFWPEEMR